MAEPAQSSATAADAVAGAGFVQENGPERLEAKQQLYRSFAGALAPDAVVASSTSTLMPTQLQASCAFAARLLVGHPFNPPHLVPLVEVVGGTRTAPETIARAVEVYRRAGRQPAVLRDERPGHLANRLQAALWKEAVDAVVSGLATAEDVDAVVTQALGPRWALLGPFLTFHLGGGTGGLAHFLQHLGPAFEGLWDDLRRPLVDADATAQLVEQTWDRARAFSSDDWARFRDDRLALILALSDPAPHLDPPAVLAAGAPEHAKP